MPGFPLSLLLLPRMEYSFLISSHHDVVIRGSGMSCCGTALMSGTGTVFLPYLPRAPDIRKIARSPLLLLGIVVVITSSGCDLYSPSLASLKHTTCMACILRLSGSWAWLESHTHAHLASLPMVSTTDKAGAVWWHWVQEQRSRAYGMDAGPKAADPEKIGAQIQTDVMITVTGSAIWSLHAAGR